MGFIQSLYIGGGFTAVDGVARQRMAHITSSGLLDAAWNPRASGPVSAIVVSGSTVYAGGDFTSFGVRET